MLTIKQKTQKSFTIKKSKFICLCFFIKSKNEVKEIIDSLKEEYSDASHICYAYILDDNTYYYTDNGEPSGSAGKPIYGSLLSNKLNYTLCVVVRYFGGIKFGPGPLRSTFKDVSGLTLSETKKVECQLSDIVTIQVEYSKVKNIVNKLSFFIMDKTFNSDYVTISLSGNKQEILKTLELMNIKPVSVKEKQLVLLDK